MWLPNHFAMEGPASARFPMYVLPRNVAYCKDKPKQLLYFPVVCLLPVCLLLKDSSSKARGRQSKPGNFRG